MRYLTNKFRINNCDGLIVRFVRKNTNVLYHKQHSDNLTLVYSD